jgi:hypothetical protein
MSVTAHTQEMLRRREVRMWWHLFTTIWWHIGYLHKEPWLKEAVCTGADSPTKS